MISKRVSLYGSSKVFKGVADVVCVWTSVWIGVTVATSAFNPFGSIQKKYLEEDMKQRLHMLGDEDFVYFHKGL